jgi:hypothetical protein
VEVLDTADLLDPHIVWQAEFWNRSVRRIFGVTGQDPSIPDLSAKLLADGRIVPGLAPGSPDARPKYVLVAPSVELDGTRLASAGQLVLWRVTQPLRWRSVIDGVTPDGWSGATATYRRFIVPAGAREVVIRVARPGVPATLPARVQATLERNTVTRTFRGKGPAVLRLPVPHRPFLVIVKVSPTFSPAQFGSLDTRTLGVRIHFRVR